MCLVYTVTCVHPLQVIVLLCTLQYCTEYSSTVSLFQAQDVIYDEKKRATLQTSVNRFFKTVDRIESSKEPEPVPSVAGVSEIAP